MPKKSKNNDTENDTEDLEEGECGNCSDTNTLKECENCSEKFCEDWLNKKGECENCSDAEILACESCGEESEVETDMNSCPGCDKIFCNEKDCWNEDLEKCNDCAEEETADWNECNGCDEKFPPEYDLVECWKCEKELCDNCGAETAKLNDREINLCKDCYQRI